MTKKWDPDQRKYIVSEAIKNMKFVRDAKSSMNDPINALFDKLAHTLANVRAHVKPILKAGGGFDEPALKQMIFTFIRDELHTKYDKEEILTLLCITLSDATLDDVRSNPSGNDKPDLLGGK